MKKLNLLAAAFLCATTAIAGNNVHFQVSTFANSNNKAIFESLNESGINTGKIRPVDPAMAKELKLLSEKHKQAPKEQPKKIDKIAYALLDARIKDPFLSFVGLPIAEILDADLYQDRTDETHFMLDSPLKYSVYNSSGISLVTDNNPKFFKASSNAMEIFASDENRVYAYPTVVATINSKYQSYFGGGSEVKFVNIAGYYKQNGESVRDRSYFGKMDDNVITFPAGSMFLFIDDEPVGVYAEDYSIALPGGKIYATGVYSQGTTYTTKEDENLTVYFYIDGDVEKADVCVLPIYCEPTEQYYKLAPDYSIEEITEDSGMYFPAYSFVESIMGQITDDIVTHLPYSIMLVAIDSDGNYIEKSGSVLQCFHQPDESAYYKSIGKGVFTDDIVAGFYGLNENPSAEVEIEESIYDPGYIRVVNPIANIYSSYLDGTTDHYLYMNVYNQDGYPIVIETSAFGLNISGTPGFVSSKSYSYMTSSSEGEDDEDDEDTEDILATLDADTNTITFPKNSLLFADPGTMRGAWNETNLSGKFSLKLPDGYVAGVKDIINDNANNLPVEYYNLQGIKIANPIAGQLVIRKQGTNTSKIIVK